MITPLLTTKLYIPRVRPELVSRPRLIERLNDGLHRKLTLISAPAGFGKTTLLSEWASQRVSESASGRTATWLSIDEGDNDPARFLAYLIAALQTIEENIGRDALGALQSPTVGSKTATLPMEELLTGLVNQVNTVPEDFVLILDDYYLITAQSIHDIVAFLLDHLPSNMHLLIATRADPPLPLARLRGRGQLTELRQSDLRFRLDEATEFLNTCMGLGLSPDDVAALASRTEGWIAGLQMAAIAVQSPVSTYPRDDVSSFIQAFTGSDRYVLDYLIEEVVQRQPNGIQAFLLQTSILDHLTGPLCDAVIGNEEIGKSASRQIGKSANLRVSESASQRVGESADVQVSEIADSQAMLEYLERNNLFVVPLDNERHWYRYHHLFADLLRQRLRRSRPDLAPILHGRASVWYEQNGLLAAAIDHALSAGDSEWAAHLIEQTAESAMLRSEVATLKNWVEALPDKLLDTRPLLRVYHALTLLLSGHPLAAIEARLRAVAEADVEGSVSGEVTVIRALIAAYQREISQSVELSRRALELLPEESLFFRSFVTGYLALNYLYSGDIVAATQAFEEAVRVSRRAGNLTITVLALCHLAELTAIQGQFYEAQALYEQALELGSDGRGQRQPIAGLPLIGLGHLLEEWNDLEAAKRHFTEGIGLIKNWGEVGAISGYIGLARVKQAQGDEEGARLAIQTAGKLAAKFDAMKADDEYVAVHRARLWIAQGNVEAASDWVKRYGLDERVSLDAPGKEGSGPSVPFSRAYKYALSAQVYIAQGRPDQALEILDPLLQTVEMAGWTTFVIKILILKALAYQARGDMTQAIASLTRALSLAEPGGLVRTFVREGTPMERLLRQTRARGIAAGYVTRLLTAFEAEPGDERQMAKSPISSFVPGPSSPLIEPLTKRELEVLRLLTTRLSSTEMAEELFISVNTVRSHIRSIYNKLDVHSRHEAVARAKQLDLV